MIRACLTGINEYDYNPDQNRLRGCVNDANNLLDRWRWKSEHISIFDSDATKQNILKAWKALRDKCHPGDVLRLTQSSHGMEEGICCHNLGVKNGAWDPDGFISYHEIADFCKEIPQTILVEILIDACHCDRQLRDLGRVYGKAKYMQVLAGDFKASEFQVQELKPTSVPPNVIMWAACEPHQTSADAYIDDKPQGAFTAAFLKFDDGRIRSDVIYYAREWLKKNGYEQRPHLYTSHDHSMEKML